MIATFLTVEDRNKVFLPGEEYSADCMSQWLQDDEVTLGAIDLTNLSGRMLRQPERSEIDGNLNEQLIVEYYSR